VRVFVCFAEATASATLEFFPTRPRGVTVGVATGTLEWYGIGQAAGSVELRLDSGSSVHFFVGVPLR
jgi:hypothetical protein